MDAEDEQIGSGLGSYTQQLDVWLSMSDLNSDRAAISNGIRDERFEPPRGAPDEIATELEQRAGLFGRQL